jgi:hypothetical protein
VVLDSVERTRVRAAREFQKRYKTIEGRARRLFANARSRALEDNLALDITYEWVLEKLRAGRCEVSGLAFDFDSRSFCPSLDRDDNECGYTQENTQVVVWIYNRAKGVGGHDDVMKLVSALS